MSNKNKSVTKSIISKEHNLYYIVSKVNNRLIFNPNPKLRTYQKRFLNLIKKNHKLSLNLLECAKIHTGQKWILKTDIKDFYGSVPFDDIRQFVGENYKKSLFENEEFYLNAVTYDKKLPAGALTSAHIANACFKKVHKKIEALSEKNKVNFSRYMDDLIFSSNDKKILNETEVEVIKILKEFGYLVNDKKTKYLREANRQEVLGIVVNNGTTRLRNEQKRKIRAMLYNHIKSLGENSKNPQTNTPPNTIKPSANQLIKKDKRKETKNPHKLRGYISYAKSVDLQFYKRLKNYCEKLKKRFDIECDLF